jgi:hypothetical protein
MECVGVLRVGTGTPVEPFSEPWRFWTSGDSAYFAWRSSGQMFKGSFHPADAENPTAVWTHGLTTESKAKFDTGSRRSHVWPLPAEFQPGWYRGPSISIPRLADRRYDFPPFHGLSGIEWVPAPRPGHQRWLGLYLTDARDNLPPFTLDEGVEPVGSPLPMRSGWHLSVLTQETPLLENEVASVKEFMALASPITFPQAPARGSVAVSLLRVTTSPAGPPLFIHIVLGSENFKLRDDPV